MNIDFIYINLKILINHNESRIILKQLIKRADKLIIFLYTFQIKQRVNKNENVAPSSAKCEHKM